MGKAVIKGTRLSVEMLMDLMARGYTHEQLRDQYPQITEADLQACLAYAADVVRNEFMFGRPA